MAIKVKVAQLPHTLLDKAYYTQQENYVKLTSYLKYITYSLVIKVLVYLLRLEFSNLTAHQKRLGSLYQNKDFWGGGDWVAESVEHWALGFSSRRDLMCCGIGPQMGLPTQQAVCIKILSLCHHMPNPLM